ncbi:hypothetical protein DFR74_108122 [Nocardia puris]|uniref:Uncharacterized protein n=1 Tax=Nocardia puris TaxID=208602 RepID=A0A366DFP4_9NOCA|nr:hypothetical protein DFR74_108122 [Nocardia puris]
MSEHSERSTYAVPWCGPAAGHRGVHARVTDVNEVYVSGALQ